MPVSLSADGAHQAGPQVVGTGLHGGEAGHRLHERIEHRLVRVRAFEPEAGDRDVDDLRIDLANRRLPHADPLGHAGSEVLHHRVGVAGKTLEG